MVELDVRTLNSVDSAGQRFDVDGVMERDGVRHFIVQRVGGESDVIRHCPEGLLPEPVDVVGHAHPVLAAFAVATRMARDDLLGYGVIAQCEPILLTSTLAQGDNFPDKLVSRYHRSLAIALPVFVPPE